MTEPSEHRGGFGDYAGESRAFIDRSFREKILLVGVTLPGTLDSQTEESLDELERLVDTAGADPVERVVQRRDAPDAATFIGKGKATDIAQLADAVDADTVVFDDELSPAQQANLERILGRSAIDRTTVILDIFAQNAHSTEGKHQVELAQLRYRLPRLRGAGSRLSQQAGGIGTRGPGETQLEVDRRRLLTRMHRLERELRKVSQQRSTQSKRRRRSANHTVALVGYTNAGKSTLLNQFAGTDVLVEDRLFATLDATTRRVQLPGGEMVYVTDTVGFVRKLPHQLVESFKTTLDVVVDADLLVHVVDASASDPAAEMTAVRKVLTEIGAGGVPELVAFNKSDAAVSGALRRLQAAEPGSVALSAKTGTGVDDLLTAVGDRLREESKVVEVLVPFERGDVMATVHRSGQVTSEVSSEGGMLYTVRLDDASASRLSEYIVGQN